MEITNIRCILGYQKLIKTSAFLIAVMSLVFNVFFKLIFINTIIAIRKLLVGSNIYGARQLKFNKTLHNCKHALFPRPYRIKLPQSEDSFNRDAYLTSKMIS